MSEVTSPVGLAGRPDRGAAFDRTAGQLRGVLQVARRLSLISDETTLLRLITDTARATLGYAACAVALRGDDGHFRYRAMSGVGMSAGRSLRSMVLTSTAFEALSHAAVRVGAVHWLPPEHAVREREDVRAGVLRTSVSVPSRSWREGSLMFVPLVGSDSRAMGFLNPDDPLSGELPAPDQALLLETLAELTTVGLEILRARAAERVALAVAEAQKGQLEALMAASAQVRGEVALDEVLSGIAKAMTTAGGFERAAIYLLVEDAQLEMRASVGLTAGEDEHLREHRLSLAEFAPAMQRDMLVSRSYLFDHRRFTLPEELNAKLTTPEAHPGWREGEWHAEDMLTVPLIGSTGQLVGLISVDQPKDGLLPDRAHVQALEFFADQCATAVEHARQLEAARFEAQTDALTGLPNRRALLIAVERAIGRFVFHGEPASVLFADIDHFKPVNDTFGHSVGDVVLERIAKALRERLRRTDLLCRYGGEEFVALLSDTGPDEAVLIAEDLRRRIADLQLDGLAGALPIRISIGVAALSDSYATAESLLAEADAAMYRAKREGRNRVAVAEAEPGSS